MTQPNDLAFPLVETNRNGDSSISVGMTKREYFAAMALQGVVSGYWANPEIRKYNSKEIAEQAVRQSDALIAALNIKPS